MRVELPGGWADVAEPLAVSERRRRPLKRALAMSSVYATLIAQGNTLDLATKEVDLTDAVYDACILALVEKWSYGDAVDDDTLADLPGGAYDALRAACFKLLPELMPRFDVDTDPKEAPTTTRSLG